MFYKRPPPYEGGARGGQKVGFGFVGDLMFVVITTCSKMRF